jgi:hypothetical protein
VLEKIFENRSEPTKTRREIKRQDVLIPFQLQSIDLKGLPSYEISENMVLTSQKEEIKAW